MWTKFLSDIRLTSYPPVIMCNLYKKGFEFKLRNYYMLITDIQHRHCMRLSISVIIYIFNDYLSHYLIQQGKSKAYIFTEVLEGIDFLMSLFIQMDLPAIYRQTAHDFYMILLQ